MERRLPLGVDLGEARVRVAALSEQGQTLRLLSVGAADVETDLADALSKAIAQLDVRETRGVAMIRACDARLRSARFPDLPNREVQKVARFEGIASFGGDEAVAVRCTLSVSEHGDRRVLIAAARLETVRRVLRVLADAGLRAVRVDHEACALARTGQTPILDIGLRRSSLVAVSDGFPTVRSLPMGGALFTQAIADAFGTDGQLAEIRKRTIGLAGAGLAALDTFAVAVAAEVASLRERDGVEVDRLSLCGNGARLEPLAEVLARKLHLPVSVANLASTLSSDLPLEAEIAGAVDWLGAIAAALPVRARRAQAA